MGELAEDRGQKLRFGIVGRKERIDSGPFSTLIGEKEPDSLDRNKDLGGQETERRQHQNCYRAIPLL